MALLSSCKISFLYH